MPVWDSKLKSLGGRNFENHTVLFGPLDQISRVRSLDKQLLKQAC